jgi:signal transduction histidine kinase
MLQLAMAATTPDEAREFLDMAQTSATTILSLVNDLLEISAVESGRFSWWKSSLIPGRNSSRFCAISRPKAGGRTSNFSYRIDDMVPLRLIGDAARTRQVLINLLGNAFAYTKKDSSP